MESSPPVRTFAAWKIRVSFFPLLFFVNFPAQNSLPPVMSRYTFYSVVWTNGSEQFVEYRGKLFLKSDIKVKYKNWFRQYLRRHFSIYILMKFYNKRLKLNLIFLEINLDLNCYRFDCGSGPGTIKSYTTVILNQWNSLTLYRRRWDAWLQLNGGKHVQGRSKVSTSNTKFLQYQLLQSSPIIRKNFIKNNASVHNKPVILESVNSARTPRGFRIANTNQFNLK